MSLLTLYPGELRGDNGQDGEDGSGVSDIRQSAINNPVLDILRNNKPTRTASSLSWVRDEEALINDRYGDNVWVQGSTITNWIEYSNDYTNWSDAGGSWSFSASGQTDPFGGSTATELLLDQDTIAFSNVIGLAVDSVENSVLYTVSFWVYVTSGTISGVKVNFGSNNKDITQDFTGGYTRVSFTLDNGGAGSTVFISPQGLSGATFIVFGVMAQKGRNVNDYIETTGAPVSVANPNSIRANEFGYLIEDFKINEIKNTEDLTASSWTLSSGIVSNFSGEDPFGITGLPIELTFETEPTITLTGSGAYINGNIYTVSLWVYLTAGSLDALTVSVAGGQSVAFDQAPTTGFQRLDVKCVAGSSPDVTFFLTSSSTTAIVCMTGFQVEDGNLTSYIRNVNALKDRPVDLVTIPYLDNVPDISKNWSMLFNYSGILQDSTNKYVFHNKLTGNNEFSGRFTFNSFLIELNGNSVGFTGIEEGDDIIITFDGNQLIFYRNGSQISQPIISAFDVSDIATTLNIGSDLNNENALNAFLSQFTMWKDTLTGDEVRYISARG